MCESSRYQNVCNEFAKRGCKLLTSQEEYNLIKGIPKLHYVASCGHEHNVHYNVFLSRGTGVKCPKCVSQDIAKAKNAFSYKTADGQSFYNAIEDDSVEYITTLLSDTFDIKRTFEGCLADLAIKPRHVKEDEWMMVQVKTTLKPRRDYGFKCNSSYKNCMIFCICQSDKKMWLLNGNDIVSKDKIAIGLYKSKYDDFQVDSSTIEERIVDYYLHLPSYKFDYIDTPIGETAKNERAFRQYREKTLQCLSFTYPKRLNLVYDFIINGKKVQEKIGSICRGDKICFTIHKNNGTQDGVRKFQQYVLGDNDFYWLNSPDKKLFWVIPENVMLNHGFISSNMQKNSSRHLYVHRCGWLDEYLFNYENIDMKKLTLLLGVSL
jgi:hypothetical protein